jgi:hypothetical protein
MAEKKPFYCDRDFLKSKMMMQMLRRNVRGGMSPTWAAASRGLHVHASTPLLARRREYDEEALREAAAALSVEGLASNEEELRLARAAVGAHDDASEETNGHGVAARRQRETGAGPVVEEGEEVGHLKWLAGEEFVLREIQPGQLAYVRILKPGITPLMAFGQKRGNKRKRFAYKGHVSPYFRLSPKSPLWKLVIAEKDLIEEGRVRHLSNHLTNWFLFF